MTKTKKQVKKNPIKTAVTNCTFIGTQWDAQAVESVSMVAKGLLNLSELFCTQNIHIDSMLKINTDPPEEKDEPYVKKVANKFKKNKSKSKK